MPDTFTLNTSPLFVTASTEIGKAIANGGPATIYYSSLRTVTSSSNDGSIAARARHNIRSPVWIVTTATSNVAVEEINDVAALRATLLDYEGLWNASTNTPALTDATGTQGDFYEVSVAGTRNLGSGSQAFDIGDLVRHRDGEWICIPTP